MKLPVATNKESLDYLLLLIKENRRMVILTLGFQLFAVVLATLLPWITGKTLDAISAGTTTRFVSIAIVCMLVILLVRIVVTYLAEYLTGVLGEQLSMQLRNRLIDEVTHLPLSVVEEAGSGDLLGRVSYDVRQVQSFFNQGFTAVIQVILTLAISYIAAFLVAPQIAWVLFIPLPLLIYVMSWYFRRVPPLIQSGSALMAQSSGLASEHISNAQVIEALQLKTLRKGLIDKLMATMWSQQFAFHHMRAHGFGSANILLLSPLVFLLLVGSYMVPQQLVTIGALTTISMYTLQLRAPVNQAMFFVTQGQNTWVSLQRLAGVRRQAVQDASHELRVESADYSLRQVSFAYGSGPLVIEDLNLDIHEGETLAVVGTSGAGKSTLARLLAGIDKPTVGRITLGGEDLAHASEEALRKEVVLVTQEHYVFSASLRENLRLAKEEATDAELLAVLKQVGADWALNLPEGLDSSLGPGAFQPSSAQAQQIALARLSLKNPRVLIMDEATSMMDPHSAFKMEHALGQIVKGKTLVMIAHRLFTAQQADRICVMEQGRIVELGSHTELLAKGGSYARLWNAWRSTEH